MTQALRKLFHAVLALSMTFLAGCMGQYGSGQSGYSPVPVYFVPVGTINEEQAAMARTYVKKKFGLESRFLPSIAPDRYSLFNLERNQFIAERVMDKVMKYRGSALDGNKSVLIGVINLDVYTETKDWEYALSAKTGERAGLISIIRADPESQGERGKEALFSERFHKLLGRNINMLYYGKPENNDPKSALFDGIRKIEDLDAIETGY
ncbi:MAG: hypothetical protein ACKVQA_16310 [Burkholderiales bacterium]